MADADPGVTVESIYAAITARLKEQFPAFVTIEFDRDDESENIPTPALLLHIADTDPAPEEDNGTGQWPTRVRFEAHVVLTNKTEHSAREIRKAAFAVATFLHLRRWPGLVADPATVIACEPDEFAPNLNRFRVWKVEWTQLMHLGDDAWSGDGLGETPESLYSWAPTVGLSHETDYLRADGCPR